MGGVYQVFSHSFHQYYGHVSKTHIMCFFYGSIVYESWVELGLAFNEHEWFDIYTTLELCVFYAHSANAISECTGAIVGVDNSV